MAMGQSATSFAHSSLEQQFEAREFLELAIPTGTGEPNSPRPVVYELVPPISIPHALGQVAGETRPVMLESAANLSGLGRYSFLTANPVWTDQLDRATYGRDPFTAVRELSARLHAPQIAELPPFQGGVIGLASYELGGAWERLPRATHDQIQIPDLMLGLYDCILAWDHVQQRQWIMSWGVKPDLGGFDYERARENSRKFQNLLREARPDSTSPDSPLPAAAANAVAKSLPKSQQRLHRHPGVSSDFSGPDYLAAVAKVVDYVRAGDIFQANLTQRLMLPPSGTPLALYLRLREVNPAPFAAYLHWGDWSIASASPERFVQVSESVPDERVVSSRPIKGTRRRSNSPEADFYVTEELKASSKDRAENTMIVDLLRNDLSRVCTPGSVSVPQFCEVETYETVQHLVSEIRGTLRPNASVWDLLSAVLPGGSITGAPKVRAQQIIAELEPTVRGAYTGSLFYAGFSGNFDSNLLIRTVVCSGSNWECGVGGGIIADSDPQEEYEETWHKAAGMLRALTEPDPLFVNSP